MSNQERMNITDEDEDEVFTIDNKDYVVNGGKLCEIDSGTEEYSEPEEDPYANDPNYRWSSSSMCYKRTNA